MYPGMPDGSESISYRCLLDRWVFACSPATSWIVYMCIPPHIAVPALNCSLWWVDWGYSKEVEVQVCILSHDQQDLLHESTRAKSRNRHNRGCICEQLKGTLLWGERKKFRLLCRGGCKKLLTWRSVAGWRWRAGHHIGWVATWYFGVQQDTLWSN